MSDNNNINEAVALRLDQDFAGEDIIAVRAVQASLNGPVIVRGLEVHNIRYILRVGDIRVRTSLNVAGFKPGGEDTSGLGQLHYRVEQYATQTGYLRKVELDDAPGSEAVFPVLLVYDQTKFVELEGSASAGHYGNRMPDDEAIRQGIIRRAYIRYRD